MEVILLVCSPLTARLLPGLWKMPKICVIEKGIRSYSYQPKEPTFHLTSISRALKIKMLCQDPAYNLSIIYKF